MWVILLLICGCTPAIAGDKPVIVDRSVLESGKRPNDVTVLTSDGSESTVHVVSYEDSRLDDLARLCMKHEKALADIVELLKTQQYQIDVLSEASK